MQADVRFIQCIQTSMLRSKMAKCDISLFDKDFAHHHPNRYLLLHGTAKRLTVREEGSYCFKALIIGLVQVYDAALAVLLLGYCEDCRVHEGAPIMSPQPLIDSLQVQKHLTLYDSSLYLI